MNRNRKKYLFILLLALPLLTGSSYVVKDGSEEVGRMVTDDGSSKKEVVTEKKLKEDAGGYTHFKTSPGTVAGNRTPEAEAAADKGPRDNYGIVKGLRERAVEEIASRNNMGPADRTTEYSAGDTYPVRTWVYEYKTGTVKHSFKVYFDTDGKVIRVNHQKE